MSAELASADDNLAEARQALAEAEDGDQWADGDLVNKLDAEVNRLEVLYREAEEENGRVQDYWLNDDGDG